MATALNTRRKSRASRPKYRYCLLLVKLDEHDPTKATIEYAKLGSNSLSIARSMAATFNKPEVHSPIGCWAIVAPASMASYVRAAQKRGAA